MTACDGSFSALGGGIFSEPVVTEGLGGELPSIDQDNPGYTYPTFDNSDGTVTRVLWLETGMPEKLDAMLKGHVDWVPVKISVTKAFFVDPNTPSKGTPTGWKGASGSEGLMLTGHIEAVDTATTLVGSILKSDASIAIEVRVVEIQENDEFGFGVDWNVLEAEDQQPPFGTPTNTTQTLFNRGALGRGVPALPGFGSAGFIPNFVTELGTVQHGIQVDLLIQALKVFTKVDVVNTPKVIVKSGHTATISAGQEVPYFQPQVSGSNTTITTIFKDVSVQLKVLPRIIANDTIRMAVTAEVKNVVDVSTVTFEGTSLANPVIATRSLNTTLDVPDGSTAILGGLITSTKIEVDEKVPILGDIPLVGLFFRNRHKADTRNRLLFFIQPKVLQSGYARSEEVILPPEPGEVGPGNEKKD